MAYLSLTLLGFPVDLPPDAQVALSYRANDLRNLDSREAAFSETFTLPLTANNAQVLGTPHALDSNTTTPYRLLPAVLTSPGGTVLLNGFGILESSGVGYDVTLTDALGGLFAQVGERSLRDLDLSAYDHKLSYLNVQAAEANTYTEGYAYPVAEDGRFADRDPALGLLYYETCLSTYFHTVLQAIVAEALPGYRIMGSLLTETLYRTSVLPRATPHLQLRKRMLDDLRASGRVSVARPYTVGPSLESYTAMQFPVENDPGGHLFAGSSYIPPLFEVDLTVKIHLRTKIRAVAGFKGKPQVGLLLRDESKVSNPADFFNGGIFDRRDLFFDVASTTVDKNVSLDYTVSIPRLQGSGPIALWIAVTGGTCTVLPGSSITFEVGPRVYPGAPVHLDANLPDLKQSDFLKLLCNQYNALIQADTITKRVSFDLFNDLERNRNRSLDWTEKLDLTTRPVLEYRLGDYAQQNTLAYQDAPEQYDEELFVSAEDLQGSAILPAVNATLPSKAEAYASPFILPLARPTPVSEAAPLWLPFFTDKEFPAPVQFYSPTEAYGEGTAPVLWRDDVWKARVSTEVGVPPGPTPPPSAWELLPYGMPHDELPTVAVLGRQTTGVLISDEYPGTTSYLTTALLVRDGLPFADLLLAYYPGLARILQRVQVLRVRLRLNVLDILSLDFTVPIKLDIPAINNYGKLSCLAYLAKVDDYTPGVPQSIECELVLLGQPVAGLAPPVPMPGGVLYRALETEDARFILTEMGYYILLEK